jgi:hypothetical protein
MLSCSRSGLCVPRLSSHRLRNRRFISARGRTLYQYLYDRQKIHFCRISTITKTAHSHRISDKSELCEKVFSRWPSVCSFLEYAISSRAQDLQVIKDSEAIQYVGKNVEVRGLVFAVYTSKKGNTFLNFGAKYPNQTFTGSPRLGRNWRVTGGPSLFREK